MSPNEEQTLWQAHVVAKKVPGWVFTKMRILTSAFDFPVSRRLMQTGAAGRDDYTGNPEATDLYEILGVARNADPDTIKSAYRASALATHPDQNQGNPLAEKKFRACNQAYEVLSFDDSRAAYDLLHNYTGIIKAKKEQKAKAPAALEEPFFAAFARTGEIKAYEMMVLQLAIGLSSDKTFPTAYTGVLQDHGRYSDSTLFRYEENRKGNPFGRFLRGFFRIFLQANPAEGDFVSLALNQAVQLPEYEDVWSQILEKGLEISSKWGNYAFFFVHRFYKQEASLPEGLAAIAAKFNWAIHDASINLMSAIVNNPETYTEYAAKNTGSAMLNIWEKQADLAAVTALNWVRQFKGDGSSVSGGLASSAKWKLYALVKDNPKFLEEIRVGKPEIAAYLDGMIAEEKKRDEGHAAMQKFLAQNPKAAEDIRRTFLDSLKPKKK